MSNRRKYIAEITLDFKFIYLSVYEYGKIMN